MFVRTKHLSDRDIVSQLFGQLSAQDEIVVSAHLAICEKCRTRRGQLDSVMHEVHRYGQRHDTTSALSQEKARTLLRSRLANQLAAEERGHRTTESRLVRGRRVGFALAAASLSLALGLFIVTEATLSYLGVGLPPSVVSWVSPMWCG